MNPIFANSVFLIVVVSCFDLTIGKISENDRALISKLRERTEGILTQDYMKEDIFLLKYLRAKTMDLQSAEDSLRKTMEWRKEKNMDNILNEDFTEIYKHAPYWMDSVDKEGDPVLIINNGRWDIRKFAVSGNRDLLTRHYDQMLEKLDLKLRELSNTTETEKDYFQATFIMDIEGYNLSQQGCFACLSIFLEWMKHTESYYPENFKSLHLINAPRIFSPLLSLLKPAMAPYTRKILHAHGPNKKEWSKVLLKTIPADQLVMQYGGTKAKLR